MGVIGATFSAADGWMLLAIGIFLAVSIFLSLAETALTRMTVSKAQVIAERGGLGSKRILRLVAHPEEFLNVVLLVVLVCQLVQATLVGLVADNLFGAWGLVLATFVNVVVVFVVAEAIPKTWAVQNTERASRIAAPVVWAMTRFWPFKVIAKSLIGLTNVIMPGKGLKQGPFVSEAEILALADQAVSADILEEEERELIEQVIEFGDTICREVMVPRPDMLAVSDSLTVADVLDAALAAGRSRVPVFGEGIDDVTGVAYMKDLVRASRTGRDAVVVSRFARRAFFVPETKRISELMAEMKLRKAHMAIVIDEYGGTAGLVTLEDLIEELVGEIVDEFDHEDSMVQRFPGGVLRVQARMSIDEVSSLLGVEFSEGDWDTIGGLMFHLLGHVPVEGESATEGEFRLYAEQVKGRRIGMVRIERLIQ
ncbi:MAG: hemolysin family protein [Acidimicrobiales bacterium]